MEFHQLITNLYVGQGKAKRIKNFPFPRQYSSTTIWLSFFCSLVPFASFDLFQVKFWTESFGVLMSAPIIWVFFLMETTGDYSENLFKGTYNDVPITAISRAIEIDLREMIDDENIPKPIEAENGFLM